MFAVRALAALVLIAGTVMPIALAPSAHVAPVAAAESRTGRAVGTPQSPGSAPQFTPAGRKAALPATQ
ncbi:hypothetical protein [Streptomyces erythrochromogenes]|uniref:hypothetical protein n=1 Tax=Streptomyces erythrochromogenes TaxID=285574 RepID=UPI0033F3EC39